MTLAEGVTLDAAWILAVLAGAGSVIALLFRQLIAAKDGEFARMVAQKDAAIAEMESFKLSFQKISAEAVASVAFMAAQQRQAAGLAAIEFAPAVSAEANSPSTTAQRETALVQTLRATLAKVKLETGQLPRVELEHSSDKSEKK